MIAALRRLGFAWVHALVVALYTSWLCDVLPPLREESAWLVVIPATGIAALVLAAVHGFVVRATTHAGRLAILCGAIWVSMLLYTAYVVLALPGADNPIGVAVFAGAAQVIYGLPLFVLVALVAKLTSPWLVARPVHAWV